ncbi:MAG: AAA family ATPase [Clostridiales bacterium]|nr:AAA family ATPase [Clostridiales bacterium]
MKLLDLHISGFGKFHDRDITFHDGINIIYGKNEAGKSTLHTFIRCMLFGLERGRGRAARNDLFSHYEPWDLTALYGGRMRVEQNGIVYRIERNFRKDQKSFQIINETNGSEVEPTKAFLDQFLCGLSETSYLNTISIGQLKSATDGGMVNELKNYIANMNTTGSLSLNITRATSYLQNRRRQFERQLHPDAARDYAALTAEIQGIEAEIADPAYENQLLAWQNRQNNIRGQLAQKQKDREELLQKIAAQRQTLASAQFTDEASITSYRDETISIYKQYQNEKAICDKKSHSIWSTVFFVLILLSGALAVYCYTAGTSNPLESILPFKSIWLFFGSLIACLIFLYAAVDFSKEGKILKRSVASNHKVLQEIFSRHLGDSSVTEDAIQAFENRMDEYQRISRSLKDAEAAEKSQSDEISALQEKDRSCDLSISQQQKTQWELEKKLDRMTVCKDRIESIKQELTENERLREEIDAIDLALETMTSLSSTIRDSFGLYLNKAASDMIREITGGAYDSMSVDDNLDIYLNTPQKLVPIAQLSSGAMDQVYLALRLSAARLIQEGYDQMPLIFDDSFVQYDYERLGSALTWLAGAYDGQILIFTCHKREEQVMAEKQIPYRLIEI